MLSRMSWRSSRKQGRAAKAGRLLLLAYYLVQVLVLVPRHQYLVAHDDAGLPDQFGPQIQRLVATEPGSGSGSGSSHDGSSTEHHEQRTCALCAVNRPALTPDTQPAPADLALQQFDPQPLAVRLAEAPASPKESRAPPALSS